MVVATTTVTVHNVAPTVAIHGAPAQCEEGTEITLTSTVTDPGAADIFTYVWSVTKDGSAYVGGSAASFSFTPDDEGTYVVSLTVTDDDDGVSSDVLTVTVVPAGPLGPVVVDHLVSMTLGAQRFDRRTNQTLIPITITNTSAKSITGPVWFVVTSISDPMIPLVNATGTLADGSPYIDLTGLLGDGRLNPSESVTVWLAFQNPLRRRFMFTYTLLGAMM